MELTAESVYPKVDGDIYYASEVNNSMVNILNVIAGENVTAGNAVYILPSDGKAYKSDNATGGDMRFTGFALETISSGNTVNVQTEGQYAGLSGLTADTVYYIGATGALTTTQNNVMVGIATSTTALMIIPSHKVNLNQRSGFIVLNTQNSTTTVTGTTAETTLKTYTLPANTLGPTGVLEIHMAGTSNGVQTRILNFYLGTTIVHTYTLTNLRADYWVANWRVFNTATNAQRSSLTLLTNDIDTDTSASGNADYQTASVATTSNAVIKVTVDSDSVSSSTSIDVWEICLR